MEDSHMRRVEWPGVLRAAVLGLVLLLAPLANSVSAQPADNSNRPAEGRRDNDRDRRDDDRRDRRNNNDFPWGLLGLAGLLGLLGLRKPKRDIYVEERDIPPPSRDVPPPRR
jgi:hypothetical protein